jgi:large subunit ribosomal protein L21
LFSSNLFVREKEVYLHPLIIKIGVVLTSEIKFNRMYAIVEIAGQQFKVAQDQKVFVHRLQGEEGSKVTFDNVLLVDNGDITIGAPAIEGAAVTAKILSHLKGDKVIVFKKKRRKGYRVKNGHRQSFTEIQIESIAASGAKKVAAKKAAPKAKAAAKTEAPKVEAPKVEAAAQDFSKMTVAELKDLAKAKGVTGISSMKKADLIAALS